MIRGRWDVETYKYGLPVIPIAKKLENKEMRVTVICVNGAKHWPVLCRP
jgi:hypothetical protein